MSQNREVGEAEGNHGPLALLPLPCPGSPSSSCPARAVRKGNVVGHMPTKVYNLPLCTSALLGIVIDELLRVGFCRMLYELWVIL